jgi:hypothetical protein
MNGQMMLETIALKILILTTIYFAYKYYDAKATVRRLKEQALHFNTVLLASQISGKRSAKITTPDHLLISDYQHLPSTDNLSRTLEEILN